MSFRDVPVPERMQHLERDARGFPIPVIVLRDRAGKPHFTVNNDEVVMKMVRQDCCSICGGRHTRRRWFVGGPLSAFHEAGAYYDPPLHAECMRYAMQTCPWLAIVRYKGRLDGRTMSVEEIETTRLLLDRTQIPGKPSLFVCVGADGQKEHEHNFMPVLKPRRPYAVIEYWRDGQRLESAEGEDAAKAVLRQHSEGEVHAY